MTSDQGEARMSLSRLNPFVLARQNVPVFADQDGNYYILSEAVLRGARVSPEHKPQVEQRLGAQSEQGGGVRRLERVGELNIVTVVGLGEEEGVTITDILQLAGPGMPTAPDPET